MRKKVSVNKEEGKSSQDVIAWVGLAISVFSIIIAMYSVIQSNMNAKTDRRVDTYTEAIISLDTLCFHEWSAENGYGEIFNSEINDEWVKTQVLEAVKIKSKLEILDKEKAESYWSIVSQIFAPEHKFDLEEYERLKESIMREI